MPGVKLRLLRLSYTIHAPLQWCFSVGCRAQHTNNQAVPERYVEIQRFMLGLANKARRVRLLAGWL